MWLSNSQAGNHPVAAIDLTPLIGVLTVLLTLFALANPATQRLGLGMRQINAAGGDWFAPLPRNIDVRVAEDGALTVGGKRMSAAEFDRFVAVEAADARVPNFHLHLARGARYATMAALLETMQRHRVRYFGFEQ